MTPVVVHSARCPPSPSTVHPPVTPRSSPGCPPVLHRNLGARGGLPGDLRGLRGRLPPGCPQVIHSLVHKLWVNTTQVVSSGLSPASRAHHGLQECTAAIEHARLLRVLVRGMWGHLRPLTGTDVWTRTQTTYRMEPVAPPIPTRTHRLWTIPGYYRGCGTQDLVIGRSTPSQQALPNRPCLTGPARPALRGPPRPGPTLPSWSGPLRPCAAGIRAVRAGLCRRRRGSPVPASP